MYRDYLNLKVEGNRLKELFEKTFIEIADENTLFELYWVIKILKENAKGYKMYIMDGKENKVATWEDDIHVYTIYHDSTGSNELMFKISVEEVKNSSLTNEFLKRQIKVYDKFREIGSKLFKDREINENIWQGRPDIIIEVRNKETNKLKKVVLGEVKYTTDKNYVLQGLRELLEYIYFFKDKYGRFVYESINQEIKVKGILFTDKIEHDYINNELVEVVSYGSKLNLVFY